LKGQLAIRHFWSNMITFSSQDYCFAMLASYMNGKTVDLYFRMNLCIVKSTQHFCDGILNQM